MKDKMTMLIICITDTELENKYNIRSFVYALFCILIGLFQS